MVQEKNSKVVVEEKKESASSKKRYWIGFFFLIAACLLMQLLATSAENVCLLYYVFEWMGLYNGSLDSYAIGLFILVAAIILLFYVAFRLMRETYAKKDIKKWLKIIPFALMLIFLVNCFAIVHTHRLLLRAPSGLSAIILDERDNATYYASAEEVGVFNAELLSLEFQKFSPGDEAFYVKLVDLHDESNEYIVPYVCEFGNASQHWERGIGTYVYRSIRIWIPIENIPGYDPTTGDYWNLRFKVVIFNESGSKTFLLYFNDYESYA